MFRHVERDGGETWLPVSDLMAGLMVIFLFIAIIYIRPVQEKQTQIKEVVLAWNEAEISIVEALEKEFREDLPKWDAELDKENLVIRFKSPEVLFPAGSALITPKFQVILSDFFPRYVGVLKVYKENIEEVRIEGHTSSDWDGSLNQESAFHLNMELSQARTREVLKFCLGAEVNDVTNTWLRSVVTANGLSSSRKVIVDGEEDRKASRRVEFRIRTNAKQQIVRVLETINEN